MNDEQVALVNSFCSKAIACANIKATLISLLQSRSWPTQVLLSFLWLGLSSPGAVTAVPVM